MVERLDGHQFVSQVQLHSNYAERFRRALKNCVPINNPGIDVTLKMLRNYTNGNRYERQRETSVSNTVTLTTFAQLLPNQWLGKHVVHAAMSQLDLDPTVRSPDPAIYPLTYALSFVISS